MLIGWQEQAITVRGTHLGQVHMDALCDQQPNLTNVDSDMTISRDPGEAKTQQPAGPHASSLLVRAEFVLHSIRVSVAHCQPDLSSSHLEENIGALPLEHMVYDKQNRQIYQQPYEHWPSLPPAHGTDQGIAHALYCAPFPLSPSITSTAHTASLEAGIPTFLPLGQ